VTSVHAGVRAQEETQEKDQPTRARAKKIIQLNKFSNKSQVLTSKNQDSDSESFKHFDFEDHSDTFLDVTQHLLILQHP